MSTNDAAIKDNDLPTHLTADQCDKLRAEHLAAREVAALNARVAAEVAAIHADAEAKALEAVRDLFALHAKTADDA